MINPIQTGIVTAVDGKNHGVYVLLEGPGGAAQGIGGPMSVQVGTFGPRDAVRIKADPLPSRGTRGVILFPRSDIRNGIWLCSIQATLNDASPFGPGFTQGAYEAQYSGLWRLDDETGQTSCVWPDGSSLVVSQSGAVPEVTRHIVDTTDPLGPKVAQVFAQSSRVPNPPSPFQFVYRHPSGAQVSVDAAGAVTVQAAAGQDFNIVQNGSPASDLVALVSKLVAAFNAHTHSGVSSGASNTGTPVTTWNSSTIASAFAHISG